MQAFDRAAGAYRRTWDARPLVRFFRARVLAACAANFPHAARILDVGCGPGTDAVLLRALGHTVVAIDASARMVDEALGRGVDARVLDASDVGRLEGPFDGALSDFGALNCLPDLRPFGAGLARILRPGAVAILVVMGPRCLAESLALLSRGRAPRRGRPSVPVEGLDVPVRWLGPSQVADELGGAFRLLSVEALGALMPPPDLGGRPGLRARIEPWVARWPGVRDNGDHLMLTLRRT